MYAIGECGGAVVCFPVQISFSCGYFRAVCFHSESFNDSRRRARALNVEHPLEDRIIPSGTIMLWPPVSCRKPVLLIVFLPLLFEKLRVSILLLFVMCENETLLPSMQVAVS